MCGESCADTDRDPDNHLSPFLARHQGREALPRNHVEEGNSLLPSRPHCRTMITNDKKCRIKSFDMWWYYSAHLSGGGGALAAETAVQRVGRRLGRVEESLPDFCDTNPVREHLARGHPRRVGERVAAGPEGSRYSQRLSANGSQTTHLTPYMCAGQRLCHLPEGSL
jgi:hypothetical protein